jgi:CDP-diacylglycerol--serine O-phosphatidyltransferase
MDKSNPGSISFAKFIPSAVTLFALCIGLMAIKYSFEQNWYYATSLLLFAAILDAVDGRLARFLNSTSEFGAELDSLADFVNFGVVPAFIIYNWINKFVDIGGFDLAMVLIYTISMAIRLARFNITNKAKKKNPILDKYFFQGIPSPVAATMMMMPLVLTFQYGEDYFFNDPRLIISYSCIIAICAVRNDCTHITLLVLGLIIVGLITEPWITLSVICVTYIISIFVTIGVYVRLNK